jgi:large subunit ribosomal protein L17
VRHRKAGKRLGRRKEERIALQRNLTLALCDQFGEDKEFIRTTITKAKWVRSFAERCITLSIKGHRELAKAADANGTTIAELRRQHTEDKVKVKAMNPKVRDHIAKSVHYRRLLVSKLRNPIAVRQLFEDIAPRYVDRPGGYLRVLRTGRVMLGNGADEAILGFVEGPETAEASA